MINRIGGFPNDISLNVLTQEKWYIDPADTSGLAANSNDGYTALTPLSDENELTRRRMQSAMVMNCCGYFPILQDTVVHYMSAPPDPYAASLMLDLDRTGSFNISYVFSGGVSRSGTLSAVTSRGAHQWWQVSGGFGDGDVHSLVADTTTNACAWVLAQATGLVDTTDWTALAGGPNKGLVTASLAAPTASDSYAVQTLARIHVGHINVRGTSDQGGTLRISPLSFYRFQFACDTASGFGFPDAMQINGQNGALNAGVSWIGATFTECMFEGSVNASNALMVFYNCHLRNTLALMCSQCLVFGGSQATIAGHSSYVYADGYVVFTGDIGISDSDFPAGNLFELGCITLYKNTDAFVGQVKSRFSILPSFPAYNGGLPEIVGQAVGHIFRVSDGALVQRHPSSGTWTNSCKAQCASFALVDGQDKCVSFDPIALSMGVTAIPINVSALDASIGSGGLGGYAVHPATHTSFRTLT